MLDIIIGVSQCEREHAEHQMKLLQDSQNATTTTNTETEDNSSMSWSFYIFLNKTLMYFDAIHKLNLFQDIVIIPCYVLSEQRSKLVMISATQY